MADEADNKAGDSPNQQRVEQPNLWGLPLWLLSCAVVVIAAIAGGAGVLWSIGSLSEWRQILYDPALDSLYRYLGIVGVTVIVYRFAAAYATSPPPAALDKPETWRAWAYLRWVTLSVVATWIFSALTPENAKTAAEVAMKRSTNFLNIYAATLIVGLLGTYAGVKQTAVKRGLKQ